MTEIAWHLRALLQAKCVETAAHEVTQRYATTASRRQAAQHATVRWPQVVVGTKTNLLVLVFTLTPYYACKAST